MNSHTDFDLDRLFDQALQKARSERFDLMEPATLAKLALLPEWTGELAAALNLNAVDHLDLDRLTAVGLIETRTSIEAGGRRERIFWLRPSERAEVGRYLRSVLRKRLAREVEHLAELLRQLDDELLELHKLHPWQQVVREYLNEHSGLSLIRAVDGLIAEKRLPEAVRLVAAATVLGDIIGGTLADAARRAQWRIDRAHRNERDEQYLRHYVSRSVVETAVRDLLADGTNQWILHLRGAAGVGKTMLVRYLSSVHFPAGDRGGRQRPVARVDFDHLPPRYPEQRPGELILALAAELLGYGETRAAGSAHQQLVAAVEQLHEELSRKVSHSDHGQRLQGVVIDRFADFLSELPAAPLLILDTCEELAKLYTPGASAPAIDRTFGLLEQIHQRVDGVRVLLAGRRWLVPPDDPRQRAAEPLLHPRPQVRVLALDGFTESEARRFVATELANVPGASDQADALLQAAVTDAGKEYFNPFELHAYCEWLRHEPGLDVRSLVDAPGDPYVERRILGRLGNGPARQALPVATAYGRFDLALVGPALVRGGVDPAAAFADLAAQEWVNIVDLGPTGEPYLLEVDPHLCDRLRAVLSNETPVPWLQLGHDAAAVIRRGGPARVPAETVEAAVRLLHVAEAAELWTQLDREIVRKREWAWAGHVCARAAGVEAIERAEGPTILAAILATQAAARLHTGLKQDVARMWSEVARYANRHPDDAVRQRLQGRAALGRLAAEPGTDELSTTMLAAAPHTSVIAAVEMLLDQGRHAEAAPLIDHLDRVSDQLDDGVPATAALLCKVVDGLQRDIPVAGLATAAVAAAEALHRPHSSVPYDDWLVPEHLLDRCRLALLLASLAEPDARPDTSTLARWCEEAKSRLHSIDSERLLSALCALTPFAEDVLLTKYVRGRTAAHWLHTQVSPLVVTMTEDLDADIAVPLLEEQIAAAITAGDDPDTVEACQIALLRRCRRDRYLGYLPNIEELADRGTPLLRAEAWLALTLVDGKVPASVEAAGSYTGWWQAYTADRPDQFPAEEAELFPGSSITMFADRELSLSGKKEYAKRSAPPLAGAAAALNPVLLADRVRRHLALHRCSAPKPPGLPDKPMDRAVVSAAEVLALRSPGIAAEVLLEAADRAGKRDPLFAWRAAVLAALAANRAHRPKIRHEARRIARAIEHEEAEDRSAVWQSRRGYAFTLPYARRWLAIPEVTGRSRLPLSGTRTSFALLLIASLATVVAALFSLREQSLRPFNALWVAFAAFAISICIFVVSTRLTRVNNLMLTIDLLSDTQYAIRHRGIPASLIGPLFSFLRTTHSFDMRTIERQQVPCGFLRSALDSKSGKIVLGLSIDEASEAWRVSWEQRLGRRTDHDRVSDILWHRRVRARKTSVARLDGVDYFGPAHLDTGSDEISFSPSLLLHVIGLPVETSAGTLWRVDDGDTSTVHGRGDPHALLAVEKRVSEGAVVILQAPAVDGAAQTLAGHRSAFLECARTVIAAGANAVFILPPLPDALALQAPSIIITAVQRRGTQDLLRALEDTKNCVAEGESQNRSWSERPVLDVLLITRR